MKKHICLEGMSGAGKSTTSKLLEEKLGAYVLVEKNVEPFKSALENWSREGKPLLDRKWIENFARVRKEMWKNIQILNEKLIVFDKYYYTTAIDEAYPVSGTALDPHG